MDVMELGGVTFKQSFDLQAFNSPSVRFVTRSPRSAVDYMRDHLDAWSLGTRKLDMAVVLVSRWLEDSRTEVKYQLCLVSGYYLKIILTIIRPICLGFGCLVHT